MPPQRDLLCPVRSSQHGRADARHGGTERPCAGQRTAGASLQTRAPTWPLPTWRLARDDASASGVQVFDASLRGTPERHALWQLALALGASCCAEVAAATTHLVTLSLDTDKARAALHQDTKLVSPDWLLACECGCAAASRRSAAAAVRWSAPERPCAASVCGIVRRWSWPCGTSWRCRRRNAVAPFRMVQRVCVGPHACQVVR